MNSQLPPVFQRALAPFAPPARLTADKLKGPKQVRLLGSEPRQAQNDEPDGDLTPDDLRAIDAQFAPEPLFSEAELLDGDRERQAKKDEECRNLTRACDEREMRRNTFGSEWDRATWMRRS